MFFMHWIKDNKPSNANVEQAVSGFKKNITFCDCTAFFSILTQAKKNFFFIYALYTFVFD